jgi:hypothetical protein
MNGGIINSVTRLHLVGYFYRVNIIVLCENFDVFVTTTAPSNAKYIIMRQRCYSIFNTVFRSICFKYFSTVKTAVMFLLRKRDVCVDVVWNFISHP